MDSSLVQAWETAAGNPFLPTVGKQTQFLVASIFLILGFTIAGTFTLNRSLVNLPLFAIPSSLAIAYGTVYMFCAVGVYI